LRPTRRPKADIFENFIYLILHFPVFEQERKTSASYEIDFIIGKNFLITVHYKTITTLYEIGKMFEVGTMMSGGKMVKDPGLLTFYIIRQMYDYAMRQMDHIQAKIDVIEENIFKGHEQKMVETISRIHRDILDFQRSLHAHFSTLNYLEIAGEKICGPEFARCTKKMISEYSKVKSLLENCQETIERLQNTNDSILTDKTNNVMKMLTLMAFITFPLMLFSSIFSMNTKYTPILGMTGDFWIIVLFMLISMSTMIFVFKRKKWF
jgi:magnesium transporter